MLVPPSTPCLREIDGSSLRLASWEREHLWISPPSLHERRGVEAFPGVIFVCAQQTLADHQTGIPIGVAPHLTLMAQN